ncbi:MAG TPA: plastocyanin/azurin family copper-binding protein [Thermoanaerobaculia bacterium]|jgi:plastocyanin|nr:plastocyanin/azurin family copper-binding protein [Thermoanaerobaculia bacterium]
MSRIPRTILALATILATVLLVLACGGGGGSSPTAPTPTPTAQTVVITVSDDSYSPKSVTINPGDTVQWVLAPGSLTTHTATDVGGAFDSGFIFTSAGVTFQQKFNQTGVTYNYSCKTHGACCNMKGSIRVGESAPKPTGGYE